MVNKEGALRLRIVEPGLKAFRWSVVLQKHMVVRQEPEWPVMCHRCPSDCNNKVCLAKSRYFVHARKKAGVPVELAVVHMKQSIALVRQRHVI